VGQPGWEVRCITLRSSGEGSIGIEADPMRRFNSSHLDLPQADTCE
jgi:hypothetical protein